MITTEKPIDCKEDRCLRYFPGGREGVQRRFGDAFREKIQGNLDELAGFYQGRSDSLVNPEVLREISKGEYRGLDCEVVHELMNLFLIDCSYGFGVPELSEEDKTKLKASMKRDRFTSIGGTVVEDGQLKHALPNAISSDGLLRLYLTLRALKEL